MKSDGVGESCLFSFPHKQAKEQSSERKEDGKKATVWAVIKVRDSRGVLRSDTRTHRNLPDRQEDRDVGLVGRQTYRQTEREIIGVRDRADRNI